MNRTNLTKISKNNPLRIVWVVIGFLCLGLGCIGVVLPILPTVPFLMATVFCFAKSSEKLHKWFIGTKLYKKNLESYVQGRGMTWATKIRIMITVTILMTFSCVMMLLKAVYIPCIVLGGVWLFHIIYFIFCVKTLKEETQAYKGNQSKPKPSP